MSNFAQAKLILTAKQKNSATIVIKKLQKKLDFAVLSVEPYYKGGFEARLRLPAPENAWPNKVYALIATAQIFGRQWNLSGTIEDEIDLTTSQFSESGIEFAWISLTREGAVKE